MTEFADLVDDLAYWSNVFDPEVAGQILSSTFIELNESEITIGDRLESADDWYRKWGEQEVRPCYV